MTALPPPSPPPHTHTHTPHLPIHHHHHQAFTLAVIKEQHNFWRQLVAKDPATAAAEKDKAYEGFWWQKK
jgi:hypothetical protein